MDIGPWAIRAGEFQPYRAGMYELNVEAEFCAAHAIVICGEREPVHGHNWRVTVTVGGERLDQDGLLIDFHALEALVAQILAPFRNADLNRVAPFDTVNPSAEHVARHIGEKVAGGLRAMLVAGSELSDDGAIKLVAVRVTEAPGCSVVYRP